MLGIFPDRLDSLHEQVDCRAFWHLRWPLQMLIHAPELVNGVEVSEGLDVFFVPPISLVLGVDCIASVQSPINWLEGVKILVR